MSWEDDQDPAEVAPGAEPGEAAPDPQAFLEALEDEQRQQVEALLASTRQETEQRFRKSAGRWGNAQNLLNEHLGITVDDSGRPAIADPERLRAFAATLTPAQQQSLDAVVDSGDEEEEWNPFDQAAVEKRLETRFEQKLKQLLDPISQALQIQQTFLGTQTFDPALSTAKTYLDRYQMGEITATPEFQAVFKTVVDGMPLVQRTDPQQLARAAMMVLPDAEAALERSGKQWRTASTNPAEAQQRARQVQQTIGNATRQGMAASTSPRGLASGAEMELTEFDRQGMALAGITDPEEWAASQSNEGYYAYMAKRNAKRGR